MKSGVYLIKNKINGKMYVGSSIKLGIRMGQHKSALSRNDHGNMHLQRAYNKYGKECFIYSVLEICNESIVLKREQYWIDLLSPKYNILKIAGSPKGKVTSEETKKKMSESHKGRPKILLIGNQNAKGHKQVAWNKGIPQSEEAKLNHSLKMKGKKFPNRKSPSKIWNKGLTKDLNESVNNISKKMIGNQNYLSKTK